MLDDIEHTAQTLINHDLANEISRHQDKLSLSRASQVLLIEDNVVALHFIETMAKQAGLQYTSAMDGEKALELAKTYQFDLVITDIGLPGISGYEFTYAYRNWEKQQGNKPIPIIGLTAHGLREAKKECLQSGMNNMLCKPINIEMMQTIISEFLQTKPQQCISDTAPSSPAEITSKLGDDLPDFVEQLFQLNGFPLLNTTLGIKNVGSELVLKRLLKQMVEKDIPNTLDALFQAHAQHDWATIEKLAHSFKGGAIYCGTMKVQYACQYLEQYHKAGYKPLLETLYQQLLNIIFSTKEVIQNYLGLLEVQHNQ